MSIVKLSLYHFVWLMWFSLSTLLIVTTSQSVSAQDLASPMSLLERSVSPLNTDLDYDVLINRAGLAEMVLIGDSTHGTQEFYQQRIHISKRLIQEKNFKLIALEGAWPDVYPLNQYIHSKSPLTAGQTLNVFNPNAAWLWANEPMLKFIQWLKNYNEQLALDEQKVSLYGIDIYSFNESKKLVIDYLQMFSALAAQQASQRYQCFSPFNDDLHRYAQAVSREPRLSCEHPVVAQYKDFVECRLPCPQEYSAIEPEAFFYAMQNARIVKNMEKALRLKYRSDDQSALWNQRDRHMMETLLAASEHLQKPKTIIWAHNSHLGDARATEMAEFQQLNLGQLLRQHLGQQIFSIGMLTYSGTVMAADDWNRPFKLKKLIPAHPDSNEALFHRLGIANFVLLLHRTPPLFEFLNLTRLQRHVGVVYRPDDEMNSHYSYTHLASQFDAIIYNDVTTAIRLLETK